MIFQSSQPQIYSMQAPRMDSRNKSNIIGVADTRCIEPSAIPFQDPFGLKKDLNRLVTTTVRRLSEDSGTSEPENTRNTIISDKSTPEITEANSNASALEHTISDQVQDPFSNWFPFKDTTGCADEASPNLSDRALEAWAPDERPEDTTPLGTPRWIYGPGVSVDGATSLSGGHTRTPRRPSPIPFTSSPFVMTRSVSVADSARSFRSNEDFGDEWNTEKLLELTENVRESLRRSSLLQDDAEDLSELLEVIFLDEGSPSRAMSLTVISQSRLDKTIAEIQIAQDLGTIPVGIKFKQMAERAAALKQSWQQRFNGLWSSIDNKREQDMKHCGHLHDVDLKSEDYVKKGLWVVKTNNGSKANQQRSSDFSPGDWWLNILCALRDGIVGTTDKLVSTGLNGVTCLAMLTGEEIDGPTRGMYEFSQQGSWNEMLWSLMCHRNPIRVVRHSNLKSKYAPKAGIRYDGLYYIRQFGHKLLRGEEKVYRCTLILERVDGQVSVNEILKIPRPSQMDDWALYERIICDDYRVRRGEEAYMEWRQVVEEQEEEKIHWLKARALEDGFRRYKIISRKASYLQEQIDEG